MSHYSTLTDNLCSLVYKQFLFIDAACVLNPGYSLCSIIPASLRALCFLLSKWSLSCDSEGSKLSSTSNYTLNKYNTYVHHVIACCAIAL